MNILILAKKLEVSSGWGRYTLDLVEFLQKNGHMVAVACAEGTPNQLGIPQLLILPAPLRFKKIHLLAFWYARAVHRAICSGSFVPDVIHCTVEPYAPIAASLSSLLGVPYVITCHGSFAVNMFDRFGVGVLQKRALARAVKIICVSDYTRQRLLVHVPKISAGVIHNGINLEHFKTDSHSAPVEPLILGVGALKERKGFDRVIVAMPEVLQAVPNAQYCIIGNQDDVAYHAYLTRLISERNLGAHVQLLGTVSEELLHSYYARAKVFALTPVNTATNFEGFGLIYLEAGAYGVPAVGSYDNGGQEVILEGKTGYLAHADDPHEVAQQIIKVLTVRAPEYEKLSSAARARAEELSWEHVGGNYLQVYNEAIRTYGRMRKNTHHV